MSIKKSLEKLKIGESLSTKVGGFSIMRVHGGWMYSKEKVSSGGYAITSQFVPWIYAPENS